MTEVEATLWGAVLGAVIGGTIGFVGAYYSYKWNRSVSLEAIRIAEFNKAAASFYTAFLDDVILIEDTDPKEVSVKLIQRVSIERRLKEANELKTETMGVKHRKAMIMFRPYIDKPDLPGFDAAWSKYHQWTKYYGDDKSTEIEYDFKSHLYSLLEYAKPK